EGDLWLRNAAHANAMARRLADGVRGLPGVELTRPVHVNVVFALLPPDVVEPLRERFGFYVWDERSGEIRWMCSWDTAEDDVDELPDVEPLVAADRAEVGFVVARIDRIGADVDVFAALDAPPEDRAHVEGRTKHIHKFGGGGWAHLRFQHNTEEAWRKNAEEVAALVDAKAKEHGVALLVLGGEQRARTFVVE